MRLLLRISLLLLASSVFAQIAEQPKSPNSSVLWEPPDWKFPEGLKASVGKEMLSRVIVGGYEIVLEKTDMKDVQQRLGGVIGNKRDAGDAEQWLCFRGADKGSKWILWLESGEINGGSVGSFQWQRISNGAVFDHRCRELLGRAAAISLPVSFAFGATRSQVLSALGPPTSTERTRLIYLHEHDVTSKKVRDDPFITSNIVIVHFRDGVVSAIQASTTTSD